jgi:succinate--hydroxymethylglutarate CoA-transferase
MMPSLKGKHLPPPTLGQHTNEVLADILGYSEDKIKKIREEQETRKQTGEEK